MYFGTYWAVPLADKQSGPTGDAYTVFELGTICFTVIVVVVNVRLAMLTHFHHWFFQVGLGTQCSCLVVASVLVTIPFSARDCLQLAIFGSCVVWLIAAFVFDAFDANGIKGGMQRIFGSACTWVRHRGLVS